MKRIVLITLLMGMTMLFSNESISANPLDQTNPEETTLPSYQTEEQLNKLAKPGTRQAPDEEGWAQKETPIGVVSFQLILALALPCIVYGYTKRTNLQKIKK